MRKRRDHRLAFRVNGAEKQALDKLAADRDVPASWLIRQALQRIVNAANESSERRAE